MKKRCLILFFSLSVLFFSSFAQSGYNISGVVRDASTGDFLPGVNFLIPSLNMGCSTNGKGKYILRNVPKGTYEYLVSSISFKKQKSSVQCFSDVKNLNISLQPKNENIGEVVVRVKSENQKRREAPEAVVVIDGKKLRGRAVSIESILNKSVGIKVRQSGGLGSSSRMMIHGLEGKRIQVFLDGDPLNSPDGSISIDDIPIDLIERIEVYKGFIPARFGGDGLGGAVNIVIREFDTDYIDLSYELSSFNTNRANWVLKKNYKKQGILIGFGGFFNKSDNDYSFKSPHFANTTIKRNHDKFSSYIISGGLTFTKLWFDEIGTEFNCYVNNREVQGLESNIQHAHRKGKLLAFELNLEKENFFLDNLRFDYDFLLGSIRNNFIDTSAYRYNFKGEKFLSPSGRGEIGSNPNDSDDKVLEMRHRLNLNYKLSDNSNLNLNTSTRYSKKNPQDDLASVYAGYNLSGYPSRLSSMISGLSYEFKSKNEKFLNIISAKYYHINSNIVETDAFYKTDKPSSRQSISNDFGYGNSFKWTPINFLNLKLSYQHALRLPVGDELFGDGVNIASAVDLNPERSDNVNLGIMLDVYGFCASKRTQLEFNAFYMNVKDMIRLMAGSMRFSYVNIGNVEVKGIEAELKIDLNENIYSYYNITYQNTRDIAKYEPGSSIPNVTKNLRLPNIPYLFGNMGIEYHKENLFGKHEFMKLYYDMQYTHEFYYNWNVSSKQHRIIPSNIVHNIGLQYVFMKNKYSINTEIHNLSNEEVWNMYKMPLMGRSFHLKFRYTISKKV